MCSNALCYISNIVYINSPSFNIHHLIFNNDGVDLFEYSKKNTLDINLLYHISIEVLKGLIYIHSHNISHGDIKMENILVIVKQ